MHEPMASNVKPVKIYSPGKGAVAALFGGFLIAGYAIARNYKAFGDSKKANETWFITIIIMALMCVLFFLISMCRMPSV